MARDLYQKSVFVNCPFDSDYQPLFRAVIFTLVDCGYTPRCALESSDSSAVRIDKIFSLIEACRLAIHDISRNGLDPQTALPRFNMPLELGIFLGARRFGSRRHKSKNCLIFERTANEYDVYCSDISGQDIRAHENKIGIIVRDVRNWLRSDASSRVKLPGDKRILARLTSFLSQLPGVCEAEGLDPERLVFTDFLNLVVAWRDENPL